ncbi:MAG: hypothetical protein CM15mP40_10680 [Alphaproteobacteria bacterium]|nr:MAG: hypothetical protein CM15mP40_10680 [Alphaproteobacteria bacterium]
MFKFFIFIALIFKFINLKAHHKIYSPRVEEGRQSLEWRGHVNYDDRLEFNKSHHHVFETEYSWTSFWQSELEFHVSDKAETPLDWEKTEFQNQVQVFDYKNFAGALYFSYNFVSEQDEPDEIEYKYLNEFNNENVSFISNFIFEKGVGKGATGSTSFDLSNQLMFKKFLENNFGFGFLGFSNFGEVSSFNTFSLQKHLYGVQIESEIDLEIFEYEISLAYLHGLTDASTNHMFLWNMELEF